MDDGTIAIEGHCAVYWLTRSGENEQTTSVKLLHSTIPGYLEANIRPFISTKLTSPGVLVPGYSDIFKENFTKSETEATAGEKQDGDGAGSQRTSFSQPNGLYLHRFKTANAAQKDIIVAFLHEEGELLSDFVEEIDEFVQGLSDRLQPGDIDEILSGDKPEFDPKTIPASSQSDLSRFVKLTGNLSDAQKDSNAVESELSDALCDAKPQKVLYVSSLPVTTENGKSSSSSSSSKLEVSSKRSSKFTNEWSDVLLRLVKGGAGHHAVRELHLAFKGKAVRDLVQFQRLLIGAQMDHYSLYKALLYLRKTQNEHLLLNWINEGNWRKCNPFEIDKIIVSLSTHMQIEL